MSEETSPRKVHSLDAGWLFHLGDIETPLRNAHIAAYMANKAGWARGAAKGDYDDSDWREISLPHDWSIEGKFDPSNHLDNGFLPRGVGWYRRHFKLEESSRGKYLAIQFDGVATHCTVYVNGHCLHRNFCGYTPFTIDISDVANFGDTLNTIAVRVDATTVEGWWYEGAGIYRHVWLLETDLVHVIPDSVFVNPIRPIQTPREWNVLVEFALENRSDRKVRVDHVVSIFDPDGKRIAREDAFCDLRPREIRGRNSEHLIEDPRLWSCAEPNLYLLRVENFVDGELVDQVDTRFGFRTIQFNRDKGFFLNDEPVKLLGTCNHQDHAGVGVAVPDSIQEFRIRMLKEMGSNAYRCAHNPPSKELLDICDRLGMLVMDENRNFGSSPEHLRQVEAMVKRDRNHPSVIMWSLCNEEAIQATAAGEAIARTMADFVRKLDPSRPITAAVSGGVLGDVGIGEAIDVMGINYQIATYDPYHAKHPKKPLLAAETHSTLATRGVYETDPEKKYFSSRDDEKAAWGATARETWRMVRDRDFVAGFFAWTGFDYRGEPTPHEWPCVNSHFGILDMCGFPKEAFYLHKAWFAKAPFVHVLPHWNWTGREGKEIHVQVYTNCAEAELLLNGESLGKKQVDPIEMAGWRVPYCAGEVKVIGYRDGRSAAMALVRTTGPAAALGLEIHPVFVGETIAADGASTLPITVFAVDSGGLRVPTAGNHVRFSIAGPAKILGVGNGNPTCQESDIAPSRSLFNGLAQVLVQTGEAPGEIVLTATADGVTAAELKFVSHGTERMLRAAVVRPRRFITDWRMSPITTDRPDPQAAPSEQDMNTWERVNPADGPQKAWERASGFAVYRATFNVPKATQARGGRVVFREIRGFVEVYIDDALIEMDGAKWILLPPGTSSGSSKRAIAVLVRSDSAPAGIVGAVELAQ